MSKLFPTVGSQIVTELLSTEDFQVLEAISSLSDTGTMRFPTRLASWKDENLTSGFAVQSAIFSPSSVGEAMSILVFSSPFQLPKPFGLAFLMALVHLGFHVAVGHGSTISFLRDVAPILRDSCLPCHNADKAKGGYRLHTFQELSAPGRSKKPPITPRMPAASHLLELIGSPSDDDRMPQDASPLPQAQIDQLKQWINEGATYDGRNPNLPWSRELPAPTHPSPPAIYPHAWPITSVAFHQNGQQLLTSGYREIRVWQIEGWNLVQRWTNLPERVTSLAFNPSRQTLAVSGGFPGRLGELRMLDTSTGAIRDVPFSDVDHFLTTSWSPSGDLLALGGTDGSIRLSKGGRSSETRIIEPHSDWVMSIAFSPKGDLLVSASRDRSARVFRVDQGEMISAFLEHGQPVQAVVFNETGEQVYSGGKDRVLRVWSAKEAKKLGQIGGFEGEIHALLRAGNYIYSASSDGKLRAHRLGDLKSSEVIFDCRSPLLSLAHVESRNRIACGTLRGDVWLVDLDNKTPPVRHEAGLK